jgi:hypothetical protein
MNESSLENLSELKQLKAEDPELFFISGRIFDIELPKEKKWLLKYFRCTVQQKFVLYYLTFGNTEQFTDHTGYSASKRWLYSIKSKLKQILKLHKQAKENFDFDFLNKIEKKRYFFRSKSI